MTAPAPEKAAPIPADVLAHGEARAKAKLALYSLRFEGQPMSSMFSAEELGLIVDTVLSSTGLLADRASQEERIREAKAIIGRLQTLVYNVRGWVSRGQSETAVKTMDAAMVDGWTAMGWRQYLEADRARLRGGAS